MLELIVYESNIEVKILEIYIYLIISPEGIED